MVAVATRTAGRPPQRGTTAVAVAVEGQSFAIDVMRGMTSFQTYFAEHGDSRGINEAGRLGYRAQRFFHEARRLASEVED